MAPSLEEALQQVELSGVYPAPLFRLMVQRELRMARRFAYPFTLLEVAVEGGTVDDDQALGVLVGNLRRHVDLVGTANGGRWMVLSPRAAQPTSLIMAERLKLLAESKLVAGGGRVSLGGVEVGPGDDKLDLPELLDLAARTVSLVKGHPGSRAAIYSVRDLREEV